MTMSVERWSVLLTFQTDKVQGRNWCVTKNSFSSVSVQDEETRSDSLEDISSISSSWFPRP